MAAFSGCLIDVLLCFERQLPSDQRDSVLFDLLRFILTSTTIDECTDSEEGTTGWIVAVEIGGSAAVERTS